MKFGYCKQDKTSKDKGGLFSEEIRVSKLLNKLNVGKTFRTVVLFNGLMEKKIVCIICTLGVSPSLVSSWPETYSFWGI